MSLSDTPAPTAGTPAKRRRWLIALPAVALLLAAAGWSVAWFYAAGRAQTEIDAWIAREATEGRNWSCASRELGGFPFRFELICAEPTVSFAGAGQWSARMGRAHAVAQVWNPSHIIAEFQAPATLTEATSGRQVVANWSLLQVSGVGREDAPSASRSPPTTIRWPRAAPRCSPPATPSCMCATIPARRRARSTSPPASRARPAWRRVHPCGPR